MEVAVGSLVGVGVGTGVRDGVWLGARVGVNVGLGVRVGLRVAVAAGVRVEVGLGVSVEVRVGLGVAVELALGRDGVQLGLSVATAGRVGLTSPGVSASEMALSELTVGLDAASGGEDPDSARVIKKSITSRIAPAPRIMNMDLMASFRFAGAGGETAACRSPITTPVAAL